MHLNFLTRIVLRHKIDRFDAGKNYTEGDTSDSESESDDSLELKLSNLKAQASISQPKNNNYNPFGSQIAEIDSILATHTYYP
ncbi:9675_t:CDS:2, partial [Acaulospora morrowiae]